MRSDPAISDVSGPTPAFEASALQALDDASTLLTLQQTPATVNLPPGSALFVVRGEVWITQEGLRDDVVLGPGARFDVRRRGMILVSATRGQADVYLASAARGRIAPGVDLYQWLHEAAVDMRSHMTRAMWASTFSWVRSAAAAAGRRLLRSLRPVSLHRRALHHRGA